MAEEEKQRRMDDGDDEEEDAEEKESETETEGDEWEGKGDVVRDAAAADPDRNSVAAAGSRRLFQRLWTDEEEIRILRGFLEFTRRRGTSFASHQYDTGPFYEEIRQQLHLGFDFTKNQLVEKLRRLKKKYRNCAARMRSKGAAFSFRSPHEQRIFDIARHIWRPANKQQSPDPDHHFSISFAEADTDASTWTPAPSSSRRARRRLPVTAAIPVSVSPPIPHEPAPAAIPVIQQVQVPVPPPPSSAAFLHSCLSPLFKELISSAIRPASLGLGPMPACPPGKTGDDKWRKQHILELEVYLQRIELVKQQVLQALHDLKASNT